MLDLPHCPEIMAGTIEISLVQEIPEPNSVLSLNGLIGVDRRTATGRLGAKEEPTRRIFFPFGEIRRLIAVATGIDIQRPTAAVTHHLQGMNFQLMQHPRTSSLLWIGNPQVHDGSLALTLERATATIEIERDDAGRSGHFTPHYLRIGTYEPNLERPIGVAWLLRDDFGIKQIDVAPSQWEYPQVGYGVTGPDAMVERIPTDTESYPRTSSAALITDRMIPPPHPLWRGVLIFGGINAFDASSLAPWGFYALRNPSQVIVGFQGGNNEFLRQLPHTRHTALLQETRPSWHLTFPASLRRV